MLANVADNSTVHNDNLNFEVLCLTFANFYRLTAVKCGAIFSHANIFNDTAPHEPPLQASFSSIPRIRIWSILNYKLKVAMLQRFYF